MEVFGFLGRTDGRRERLNYEAHTLQGFPSQTVSNMSSKDRNFNSGLQKSNLVTFKDPTWHDDVESEGLHPRASQLNIEQ